MGKKIPTFSKVALSVFISIFALFAALAVPLPVFSADPVAQVTELTPDWAAADTATQRIARASERKSAALIAQETADHEIGQALSFGRASVLVHMDPAPPPGLNPRANVRAFAVANGGVVKHEYNTVLPHVVNLRNIPEGRLNALANLPGVRKIELDEYHPDLVRLHDSTPLIRSLQSQITGAGHAADGAGVRVCVADTGIDSDHVMYSDRIDASAGYDFYNNDNNPEDDNGHGSHVAGIAVGGVGLSWDPCGTGSMPFQGVAPAATLIGAKILNSLGGGYDSDIIAGIDHCADQSASGGRADVINLSIGIGQYGGPCAHSWAVAANNAVANGVVVVAAAGNENYSNALSSPACGVDVIAVGMTWKSDYPTCEDPTTNWNWGVCTDYSPQTDEIGCFSNESDHLDVAAPGANIWSASNAAGGSSITGSSGTSMSSPQVAGLAALVLGMNPSLTPVEVRQIIRDGAIDMGPAGFDRAYGYGRIDVLDTLALVGPQCSDDADCDDSDPCTIDDCVEGACSYTPMNCPSGEACVDGACVTSVCNENGTCESGEDCNNCPNDCISGSSSGAVCGNGLCETSDGEDCQNCSADCNGKQTGRPSGRFCCGATEDCSDARCIEGAWSCTTVPQSPTAYCCGDKVCESAEDSFNCEVDCGPPPYCGDGTCDPGEDQCNCPGDCEDPPEEELDCSDGIDNDCDGLTDGSDEDCVSNCSQRGVSC
ncbi:MAG: S8 family serine peptidase, partial [Desulfobacterales bacterium]